MKLTLNEIDRIIKILGGSGSGNFGHAGRPGEVGGSQPTRSGWGDEHARKNASTIPGKRKFPWEMTRKESSLL